MIKDVLTFSVGVKHNVNELVITTFTSLVITCLLQTVKQH